MLRIVHYIGSTSFGGIERLVYDLVSQQIKRGSIITTIGVGKFKGEYKTQFESLGSTLINFNLTSGYDLDPFKILKVSRVFKDHDVIHLHGFHLSIALAAILSQKKIIYTEHGNFGFGRSLKNSDKISFFLRKLFFKYSKAIICCNSNYTKNFVEKRFYKGKKLRLVYNGSSCQQKINLELLKSLKIKYSQNFVIGCVGRLAGVKRTDKVIDLFSEFLKTHNTAKLLIIGEGVEKEKLLKKVENLKIAESVDFLGYQKEVNTYHALFDVSILGSFNEAFGLVAIESYSAQTPVLAFDDGGGVTEIINRFCSEDVCRDRRAMIKRLNHYRTNKFILKNDNRDLLDFFSIKRMEQDYYKQYEEIF